jgi:predicted nucleotidyltransferase
MSLAGFEHVFIRSIPFAFAPDIRFRVVPPPVIAILKIVAYSENQKVREKDLTDLKSLLQRYEASSDRIFSDDVFAAELEDIEYTSAFLLGLDVGAIATPADNRIVRGFLVSQQIPPAEIAELDWDDFDQREILRFQMQLKAFEKGLQACHPR